MVTFTTPCKQQMMIQATWLVGPCYGFMLAKQRSRFTTSRPAETPADPAGALAQDLLLLLEAFQQPAVAPAPASSTPVCSLALAADAHKVLLQQALLLRGKLEDKGPGHITAASSNDSVTTTANITSAPAQETAAKSETADRRPYRPRSAGQRSSSQRSIRLRI